MGSASSSKKNFLGRFAANCVFSFWRPARAPGKRAAARPTGAGAPSARARTGTDYYADCIAGISASKQGPLEWLENKVNHIVIPIAGLQCFF